MDVHTKEQRSYNMSRVKSKNTKPEKLMFALLKKSGYKFKKHYPIIGKPDIVFPHYKVVIFINGEFWHGKDYFTLKENLAPFWVKKIGENITRDRKTIRKLRSEGWHILQFWDKTIIRTPDKSLKRVARFLEKYSH